MGRSIRTQALPVPPAPRGGLRRISERAGRVARATGALQCARIAACVASVAAAEAFGRCGDLFHPRAARSRRRSARRERAVLRVVATLGALKGAFAKAGQFAALRHDVLSGPAIAALAGLRDRVPPLPFERVRAAVEAALGAPLASRFSEFEPTPIGAASLAQAHRAKLPSGERVVVKVQYPWLRSSTPVDLALLRALLRLFARNDRQVDWRRAFDEFAAGLAGELDFLAEARSAIAIAANLADDDRVVVPAPVPSHTTAQVLTVADYPTIPVSDASALAARGISPRAVLEILARAYAKQVFVDGLFHADPHPGNLFVIDEPRAATEPRLLFIDFGLCRHLAPELRRDLRLGLYALIQRDVDAFVERMDGMGMIAPGTRSEVRQAIAKMFDRLAASGGALAASGSAILALKQEAVALLQDTRGIQLPVDLLLYARTLTTVFALGAELDPEVDMMKLTLPYLLQFLAKPD